MYRLVKKIAAVTSLVLVFIVVWFLYLLIRPLPSSGGDHTGHRTLQFNRPPPSLWESSSPPELKVLQDAHQSSIGVIKPRKQSHRSSLSRMPSLSPEQQQFRSSIIKQLLSNASDFNNLDSTVGRDYLSRMGTNCRDRICSELLTDRDPQHFKYCIHKTWDSTPSRYTEPGRSTCVFVDGSDRHPMGLASYPGSGNTWVRGLLQRVTGLCTGAVYCDVTLRQNGFPGESIRGGAAFVVKTHQVDPRWQGVEYPPDAPFAYFERLDNVPVYSGGVFIARNPFHAMVAEYKRQAWTGQADNHVKTLGREYFGNDSRWDEFVRREAVVWQETVLGWLVHNMDHPVLVTRYEDLKEDTGRELERILFFLQVPYSRQRLEEVVREGYSEYHRPPEVQFPHYTETQTEFVKEVVRRTSEAVGYVQMSDYLQE